jgi:hypothetical protein
MRNIQFSRDVHDVENLENLQREFGQMGINAFFVDYDQRTIEVAAPSAVSDHQLACAVKRAGYKCNCFRICNHAKD